MSDEAFADVLGVGRTTYRNWKIGAHTISADQLVNVAARLGVTTDWLLGIEGAVQYRDGKQSTKLVEKRLRRIENNIRNVVRSLEAVANDISEGRGNGEGKR